MASDATEMIKQWRDAFGPSWVRAEAALDAAMAPLGQAALEQLAARPGDHVLDVGCGCGATVLALAEAVGPSGRVTAVDPSTPMLARARERAREAGVDDRVTWIEGDAQRDALGEALDGAYSRFGVMFFDDPVAAFRNIRRALRPGAPLAFVCWAARGENPWMTEPSAAAAALIELGPPPEDDAPGPFGLADPIRVRRVLEQGGFAAIDVTPYRGDLLVGPSVDAVVEMMLEVGAVAGALRRLSSPPDLRARVADAVRAAVSRRAGPDGVRAPGAAWVVSARADEG